MKEYDVAYLKKILYSGILCDVLDQLGYRNQSLGYQFKILDPDSVLFGRAFTSIGTQVYSMPKDPLTAQCQVIDRISTGDVYCLATRGAYNCAVMGELLATAITVKKGEGALIDGMARDLKQMKAMDFSLFYKGALPVTSKGRCEVTESQIPILIDGVTIHPGDLVFGDFDGIVILPQEIADQVIEKALEIVLKENKVRESLLHGTSLAESYAKIGAI